MSDVEPLLYDKESAIFYKNLKSELNNVEIHTSKACLVYIESGYEIITTCDNERIELFSDDIVFFPKGVNFHSDYTNKEGSPSAFVIFFGDDVVTKFLPIKKIIFKPYSKDKNTYKIVPNSLVKVLFSSLHATYKTFRTVSLA
jgi:hypothetical protein